MNTIFINSENSKTFQPHDLLLKLTDKLSCLRRDENIIALLNLSIYYTWKNIKRSYNNNKFEISAPTWNDKFELPDEWNSVSDIQDYFEDIFKKHGENIDKPSVQIYVNKTENRVTFKIKDGYSLEFLTPLNKFNFSDYIKTLKMRYSIKSRDSIYVKGYEFLSFAKTWVKT